MQTLWARLTSFIKQDQLDPNNYSIVNHNPKLKGFWQKMHTLFYFVRTVGGALIKAG
jgi:hypothetical protein